MALKLPSLNKSTISILISYLREKFNDISTKKFIILIDNNYCIPRTEESTKEFTIFDDINNYLVFIHENPIRQYILIKEKLYRKEKNCLIITNRKKELLKSFYCSEIKINPKSLLEYYFEKKLGKKITLPTNLNDISFLIWNSLDFIERNIERYQAELENKNYIEILFRELLIDGDESLYLLKKIFLNSELFFEIYHSSLLKNLKRIIKSYISNIFPKSFSNVIEKCLEYKNFRDLFNLLITISYIKQFNHNLDNFEVAIRYINSKTEITQILDTNEDIIPLNSEIKEVASIGDNFINYVIEILSEKKKPEIKIFKNIGNLIKSIENDINLFEIDSITNKSIFFPEWVDLQKNFNKILFHVPSFWLSFNFLEYFIMAVLRWFFKNPKLKELKRTIIEFSALNFKSIDQFKENIFYVTDLKNSEYWIKLNFLENFIDIILYLYHLRRNVIPLLKNIKNDHIFWKTVFERYYLHLSGSIEALIENTLQFIPTKISNIEIFVKRLEKIIFNVLKEINNIYKKYLLSNYKNWVSNVNEDTTPLNVVNVLSRKFFPNFKTGLNTFNLFLFIDCCHVGIWNILKQKILNDFPNLSIQTELGFSILPTSTKYARASLFSGEYPKNIQSNDELKEFLRQFGRPTHKAYIEEMNKFFITNCENMFDFKENIENIRKSGDNFQISIFNFSDKTSHTYSQNFLKSLIDSMYNSKIRPLIELVIRNYKDIFIFFATDHGISRCTEEFDWENDKFNRHWENDIFHKKGVRAFISYETPLNRDGINKNLIYLKDDEASDWGLANSSRGNALSYFFATNFYNLKKTPENKRNLENFGHGGASMDEFIIPFAIIEKKGEDFNEFNWNFEIKFTIEDSTPNKHLYKVFIKNHSNKEIIFNEGHLITELIHHKFILHSDYLIHNNSLNNELEIKFRFPRKYFHKNAFFYFTFYQDEKLETSDIIYA